MPARSATASRVGEARGGDDLRDRVGLAEADLEREQRRAGRGGLRGEAADQRQAVRARVEGHRGLVAGDVGGERAAVAVGDVGRVGEDGVERALDGLQQVALEQLHLEREPLRVGARDRERLGARVGGDHVEVRALGLQRQRHRAGARADVGHARAARQPERGLDQVLGLRARDQHAAVDEQVDRAEALGAEDVGDGLALRAAHRVALEAARLLRA